MLTFGHEIFKNLSDCLVADLVLRDDGRSDHRDVSISCDIDSQGKLVSVLFCDGKNMGKMHLVWHGFPVSGRSRTANR